MKRLSIISVSIFLLTSMIYSQDIINETGKDGKFIVRDAEQQEALVIEDGNVGITGELSVEQMPEGTVSNPYVVWDPNDKKFKTVDRLFSKVSPLSEPLETRSWHSVGYDGVGDDGISASVQGTAASWNRFTTDYGYIQLGPANTTAAHIYTDATHDKFVFNKPVFTTTGEFSAMVPADLFFRTGVTPRMTMKASNGNMGVGTTSPTEHLHVKGTGVQRIRVQSDDSHAALQIDGNDSDGLWMIQSPQGTPDLDFVNWSTANGNGTRMTLLSNGNVGIGTATPLSKLHIEDSQDAGSSTPILAINNTASSGQNMLDFQYQGITIGRLRSAGASDFHIEHKFGGNIKMSTDDEVRMTIQDDGDVGIGTTNPAQKLDVVGTTQMTGFKMPTGVVDGHVLTTDGGGVGTWQTPQGGGDFSDGGEVGGADRTLGNTDNYALGFKTNNSTRLNILNDGGVRIDGNVGISVEPIAASTANRNLQIYDGVTFSNPYIHVSGHNSAYLNLTSRRVDATSGKTWRLVSGGGSTGVLDRFAIWNTDDGNCFSIRNGGNVGIGTDVPEERLQVAGNMRLDGAFEDKDGEAGTAGQILSSTATGTDWITAPSADNLGNHTATQNVILGNNWLSGDGDAEGIFVDGAGEVGIGTTSPVQKLQIVDGHIMMDNAFGIFWGGTIGTGIYGSPGDFIRFSTAGLDRMYLTPGGLLGIGTLNPYEALHVIGKIRSDTGFNNNNSDGVTGTWNFYNDGTPGNVTQIVISGGIITNVVTTP